VKTAYSRQRAKKKLFAAWRLCAQKIKCLEEEKFKLDFTPLLSAVADRLRTQEKIAHEGLKKMARKGAETQRNKGVSHKGEEVQRKISLRLGGFARRKK
jgi:hypothetical protein